MRAEHFRQATLPVRVPRGNEGFWQIICQLSKTQGTFTVSDIDGESNVNAQLIRKYIRLLVEGGFVQRVGGRPARFAGRSYRLAPDRWSLQAPRVRADGSLISTSATEQLWTAIRTLKTFGLKELIFAATTDGVAPTYALAKRYAHYLTAAGYLTVAMPARGTVPQVWRLKPGMNTGPLPPGLKVIRANAMWDPNLKQFVGEPATVSEVSP